MTFCVYVCVKNVVSVKRRLRSRANVYYSFATETANFPPLLYEIIFLISMMATKFARDARVIRIAF